MKKHNDRLMSVMAPLMLQDTEFAGFSARLKEARDIGVEAVTVDVWWGQAMEKRDPPNWLYYDRVFDEICKANLLIIPIMSFHRCGAGQNDGGINIGLPPWLSDFVANNKASPGDLSYQSETGFESNDAIPPWIAEEVPTLYDEMARYVEKFLEQYKQQLLDGRFPEINISLGPTGELRYPAYNTADNWSFPHRGLFQCYSKSAGRSFVRWVRASQKTSQGSCSWATDLQDSEIRVPNGHVSAGVGARADTFVAERQHASAGYGQDFLAWYHQSLLRHGKLILKAATKVVREQCQGLPKGRPVPVVGMKIPGVHWQWRCTGVPRYAELTAGLIPGEDCFVPDQSSKTGYENVFAMAQSVGNEEQWPMRVHFTALEMDDDAVDCSWGNDTQKTSMAASLVNAVGRTAASFAVLLCGENADGNVAAPDNPHEVRDWVHIRKAFDTGHFSGFTLLRLTREFWDSEKESLEKFIQDYDGNTPGRRVLRKSKSRRSTRS